MNKAIHFKTSMFDVSTEKENPINPVFGLSLLEWLRAELKNEVDITVPDAEDWGWYSELEWDGAKYLIGSAAFYEKGDDPNQELEWVFQVHRYRTLKEKILGRNKMSESNACFQYFKKIFENHSDITGVEIA
ncbi:hypothetical protein [Marinagarivorans algicola]|uniref:hypothetical protein n=1 Tax=Marinagarivorans algicola TaxID=1513270 RepID=UPI0006B65963|nr:hypothetical protein [Marinagarivorans algicola]